MPGTISTSRPSIHIVQATHISSLKDDLARGSPLVLAPEAEIQHDGDGADDETGSDACPEAGDVLGSAVVLSAVVIIACEVS